MRSYSWASELALLIWPCAIWDWVLEELHLVGLPPGQGEMRYWR